MKSVKSTDAKLQFRLTGSLHSFLSQRATVDLHDSLQPVQPLCPEVPPPPTKNKISNCIRSSICKEEVRTDCADAESGPCVQGQVFPARCHLAAASAGRCCSSRGNFYALRNCLCVFPMMIPTLYLTSRGGTCWRSFNFTLRCNGDETCVNSNVSGLKHPVIYYGLPRILINYYVLSF